MSQLKRHAQIGADLGNAGLAITIVMKMSAPFYGVEQNVTLVRETHIED